MSFKFSFSLECYKLIVHRSDPWSYKPKDIFFIKVNTLPRLLKRLIQTRPHMSTSRCENICIRCGFSNRSSVDAVLSHFMYDRFVNLGEEVILTLLWQSGASESATVCFIRLSICYWLLFVLVLVLVCVRVCVCLCVCVWERERERVTSAHLLF